MEHMARAAGRIIPALALFCFVAAESGTPAAPREAAAPEPSIEVAKQWWPELPNKWTAVGWKDHMLRFNVLHNGTILNAYGWMPKTRAPLPDPCCQFTFFPGVVPEHITPPPVGTNPYLDDGSVVQGWNDGPAPVLWSEWSWCGFLQRQEVFAHVPGGKEVTRGDEPLFAWVRLSVHYACEGMPLPERAGFGVRVNHTHVGSSMKKSWNLYWLPDNAKYPRDLKAEPESYDPAAGLRLLEPDGRVRLAVAPGQDCVVTPRAAYPTDKDFLLHVQMPPKVGSHVDLLIPMLPTDRNTFGAELALGYEGALAEANRYWSRRPATAATFEVPERYVDEAIRRNLQSVEVMAEKDPASGDYAILTGAWGYGIATWATCVSIAMAELLDPLGHHSVVEKYLAAFKQAQGKGMPPGPSFKPHPGYLGAPERFAIVNWLPDHGALLWAIAQHGLLTGDPRFIEEYTPVVVKACEWIQYARRIEGHGGVPGVMPPAGSSDDETRVQMCWSDGWVYKGLSTAVRFLKRIRHPRAEEFAAEAREYKAAFAKAFRARALTMPTWTDAAGKQHRVAPVALAMEGDFQRRGITYLDTGPMHLVFAGLMDASDPLMRDALLWAREGPPTRLYRPDQDYIVQVPSLRHEMSSWEPCYSWNVFHNWQSGDRMRFLEGMYSLFAGAYSQQTYTVCESRGGMTANTHWLPSVTLARLAVVDDQLAEDELHLLRLVPLAWLKADFESRWEKMPTCFGPVTLKAKLASGGRELRVSFTESFRALPPKVILHVPPVPGLAKVILNGRPLKWSTRTRMARLR